MINFSYYYLIIISIFFYTACDEFNLDSNSKITKVVEKTNTIDGAIKEKFFYEQWSINKNNLFYKQNNIDKDAHINMDNLLSTYSGKGIKIAIIDIGFNDKHEDLQNAVIDTYNSDTDNKNIFNPSLGFNHGTSVAGIIGARRNNIGILGIAYEAELIFLNLGSGEKSTDLNLISIFYKALDLGADIINCSWGSYDVSDIVKSTLIDLANNGRDGKGIPIVFASGNNAQDMGNDESNIEEMISVGATNINNLKAKYTNYGKNLDVMAPGGYKLGITTLGNNYYSSTYKLAGKSDKFIGTSASAPIVSGVIALMLQKNPELTRIEVENILKKTSDQIGDLEYVEDRNNYYGYGKINVSKAMEIIDTL